MKYNLGQLVRITGKTSQSNLLGIRERYGEIHGLVVPVVSLPGDKGCRCCGRIRDNSRRYAIRMPDGKCWSVPSDKIQAHKEPPREATA